jgi:hypothetical protein
MVNLRHVSQLVLKQQELIICRSGHRDSETPKQITRLSELEQGDIKIFGKVHQVWVDKRVDGPINQIIPETYSVTLSSITNGHPL